MGTKLGRELKDIDLSGRWLRPTKHGHRQTKQRSIPPAWVDIVKLWGVERHCGRGCVSFSFDKKTWAQLEKAMGPEAKAYERARNIYVIISRDGSLVTAAHRWN